MFTNSSELNRAMAAFQSPFVEIMLEEGHSDGRNVLDAERDFILRLTATTAP